jgi:hypothetical protein
MPDIRDFLTGLGMFVIILIPIILAFIREATEDFTK